MANFFEVSGWRVGARHASPRKSVTRIGRRGHSLNGQLRQTRRALKRQYQLLANKMTSQDAEFLESLLEGEGEYWSFTDNLYSTQSKGPTSGHNGTHSGTGGKFDGEMIVSSAGTVKFAGILPDNQKYTIMVFKEDVSEGFDHYIRTYDGVTETHYKNGVIDLGIDTNVYLTVNSDGSVDVKGQTKGEIAGASSYSDLVVVPALLTQAAATAFAALLVKFSPLPSLTITGDILEGETSRTMLGTLNSAGYDQGPRAGTWNNNLRNLAFTLDDV